VPMAILIHSRAEESLAEESLAEESLPETSSPSSEAVATTTTTAATEVTTLEDETVATKTITITTGRADETGNTKPLRDANVVDIPINTISLEEILKPKGTDRWFQMLTEIENCLEF